MFNVGEILDTTRKVFPAAKLGVELEDDRQRFRERLALRLEVAQGGRTYFAEVCPVQSMRERHIAVELVERMVQALLNG